MVLYLLWFQKGENQTDRIKLTKRRHEAFQHCQTVLTLCHWILADGSRPADMRFLLASKQFLYRSCNFPERKREPTRGFALQARRCCWTHHYRWAEDQWVKHNPTRTVKSVSTNLEFSIMLWTFDRRSQESTHWSCDWGRLATDTQTQRHNVQSLTIYVKYPPLHLFTRYCNYELESLVMRRDINNNPVGPSRYKYPTSWWMIWH